MVQILVSGFKISNADKLALENDLLITPFQWIQECIKGMINKATKSLIKDYIEELKENSTSISTDKSVLIAQIDSLIDSKIALYEASPETLDNPVCLIKTATFPEIIREEEPLIELLPDGINIESWEKLALDNYYEAPEEMIRWFITNKIYSCRKRFVEVWQTKVINEQLMPSIPSSQDAFINAVVLLAVYENRATREEE